MTKTKALDPKTLETQAKDWMKTSTDLGITTLETVTAHQVSMLQMMVDVAEADVTEKPAKFLDGMTKAHQAMIKDNTALLEKTQKAFAAFMPAYTAA